ncbi:TetR/AcrR family transcriptional regulator [Streptomyces sp. NPDC087856]|uniref:TetR/AcrR family transcriptional regulator n=1 Tax=Streptomyces sp. NPDC087856 TaxID=3365811 RepID=UPI00381D1AA9
MNETSKTRGKEAVLQAAFRLLTDSGGIQPLTLGTVAQEAGMSKPGVLHHFPTMDHLRHAVLEHAARNLTEAMTRELTVDFDASTPVDRMRAYIEVTTSGRYVDSYFFFSIFADASYRPIAEQIWQEKFAQWFELPDSMDRSSRRALILARLAAEGFGTADATKLGPFRDATDRAGVRAMIFDLLPDP